MSNTVWYFTLQYLLFPVYHPSSRSHSLYSIHPVPPIPCYYSTSILLLFPVYYLSGPSYSLYTIPPVPSIPCYYPSSILYFLFSISHATHNLCLLTFLLYASYFMSTILPVPSVSFYYPSTILPVSSIPCLLSLPSLLFPVHYPSSLSYSLLLYFQYPIFPVFYPFSPSFSKYMIPPFHPSSCKL